MELASNEEQRGGYKPRAEMRFAHFYLDGEGLCFSAGLTSGPGGARVTVIATREELAAAGAGNVAHLVRQSLNAGLEDTAKRWLTNWFG